MEKKKYEKPAMQVYMLKNRARLLAGSGEPNDYPYQFG